MEIYAISPASAKPLWFVAAVCVIVAAVLATLAHAAYASRHSRVEIESDRIRLVRGLWGREIPLDLLRILDARVMDLAAEPAYALERRTFGTGLPGYASGWFRLRNGEKALVCLTRRDGIVYVPTSAGYSLLLSVQEPERFVGALQRYSP
jgi:hypothetical protein